MNQAIAYRLSLSLDSIEESQKSGPSTRTQSIPTLSFYDLWSFPNNANSVFSPSTINYKIVFSYFFSSLRVNLKAIGDISSAVYVINIYCCSKSELR